jgi:hypothetical protein
MRRTVLPKTDRLPRTEGGGAALTPPPPGLSKSGDTRYLDVRAGTELDEAQLRGWDGK